jgi:hypothetical protein
MKEIWKTIPGFEGRYEVSDRGRVRSLDRRIWRKASRLHCAGWVRYKGQLLRPGRYTIQGHVSVPLGRPSNGKPVHSLVLSAFVGARPPGKECLHNNGNAADNRLSNLRYGTRAENNRDISKHGRRKLTLAQVSTLRAERKRGVMYKELAKRYGICQSQAFNIASGAHYRA